jgi:serine/threonine protein kinase
MSQSPHDPKLQSTPSPGDSAIGRTTDSPAIADVPTIDPSGPGAINLAVGALVGQTFGDFELLQEVGRGGMGVVYKARQYSLDRFVALKLLLTEHAANATLLQRFLTEARAAAGLQHPNIVQVHQVGECVAGPYFVMEYIDGPSLEVLTSRTVPVSWAVALLLTVSRAVQFAHQKGIIHRDLKPGNIMLHQSKRPVVLDFGIAKLVGKNSGWTLEGTVIGTPAFMPPEQAGEQPDRIGPHSDVYSLGAILYTLLTGRLPFQEETAVRTILKVISPDLPPPVRSIRPEVPPLLEQVCMKALAKDISQRYPTALALVDALDRARASLVQHPSSSTSLRIAMPTLVLIAPDGRKLRLFNPCTVIGRAADCDLVLKSADVSKHHCRLLIGQEEVAVEDLDSVNGTLVNGEAIQRVRLHDGDEIDIAGHVFHVRLQGLGG